MGAKQHSYSKYSANALQVLQCTRTPLPFPDHPTNIAYNNSLNRLPHLHTALLAGSSGPPGGLGHEETAHSGHLVHCIVPDSGNLAHSIVPHQSCVLDDGEANERELSKILHYYNRLSTILETGSTLS